MEAGRPVWKQTDNSTEQKGVSGWRHAYCENPVRTRSPI